MTGEYRPVDGEEEARRLLAPLAGDPDRPSTVDISAAMAAGRRRLRVRRFAGMLSAAAVTAVAVAGVPAAWAALSAPEPPPHAATEPATAGPGGQPGASTEPIDPPGGQRAAADQPPSSCQAVPLPVPEGSLQSVVTAADPTGRYQVGRSYIEVDPQGGNLTAGLDVRVVLWHGGQATLVDMSGYDPVLSDVNSTGTAVGSSFQTITEIESRVAWIYQDGTVSRLIGDNVEPVALNEQGAVAGTQWDPEHRGTPVVWRSPQAEPEQLSLPGPDWGGWPVGIDEDGTILGVASDLGEARDGLRHWFFWRPDGTRHELVWSADPDGIGDYFEPERIHEGVVTGRVRLGYTGEVRFTLGQLDLRTGVLAGVAQEPAAVLPVVWNSSGWLVGNHDGDLVLWVPEHGAVALPVPDDLLPGGPFHSGEMIGLSDDGRVAVGQLDAADSENWRTWAVAWHCQ